MTPRTVVNSVVIPEGLKAQKKWVLWKYEAVGNKQTKVLYGYQNGKFRASVNKWQSWLDFQDALNIYVHNLEFSGIGYVLTKDSGLIGIDIDGRIAQDVVDIFQSYAEISPSGNGTRIFIAATSDLPVKKTDAFEVYDSGRFLTVTGNVLGNYPLRRRQETFDAWYQEQQQQQQKQKQSGLTATAFLKVEGQQQPQLSPELQKIVLDALTNDDDILRYMGGCPAQDIKDDGTQDTSKSRFWVVKALWGHTGDHDQVYELMLASGMNKAKWFEPVGNSNRILEDIYRIIGKVSGR